MIKITAKLEVNETRNTINLDLDDLGISNEEWSEMSEEQKYDAIKNYVYDLPEQPYWSLDKFTEK